MVDNPSDQTSRWSTNNNTTVQYIMIKLAQPAIVKSIVFGKYHKAHVCNIKRFSVRGGMNDENLNELLIGGLENNSAKEEFALRHTTDDGHAFPVMYISIVPLQSWGPAFNYSIWYLEFHGIDDPALIKNVLFKYNLYSEKEAIRLCLKHFRQQKYMAAYRELQRQTGVTLEAPQLTRLYELLVEEGDFEGAENVIKRSAEDGLFDWYVSQQPYIANWNAVSPCSPELLARLSDGAVDTPVSSPSPPLTAVSPDSDYSHSDLVKKYESNKDAVVCERGRPGRRGGHQMCIDSSSNIIYMFGGWDGENDLSDLWSYNASEDKWTTIFDRCEDYGGPKPRSCHKMVLDSNLRQMFVFGRYIDTKHRSADGLKSDFYMFDINKWQWTRLNDDTSAVGGPSLIFDHQMCVDAVRHIIYVFGGKILTLNKEEENFQYSGLYAYYILENRWQLLLPDISDTFKPYKNIMVTNVSSIQSRGGHSMLYHPTNRMLYIFGGQRNKEHQAEFLTVDVGTNEGDLERFPIVNALCRAASKRAPPSGFTQRATIDPDLNEIYVLSGLSKEKDKRVSNSLWVYSIVQNQWSCIYKNDNQGHDYWTKMHTTEPCPRFAHQLVYDSVYKIHYLFGGNPGKSAQPSLRLDDFWTLKLSRVRSASAFWRARLFLRRLRYQELAESGRKHDALVYLQNDLHEATDHTDAEQVREFQLMASALFADKAQNVIFNPPLDSSYADKFASSSSSESSGIVHDSRTANSSTAADQQAMFAAVLGMESNSSESPEKIPNTSFEISENFLHSDHRESSRLFDRDVEDEKWDKWENHYRRCQLFQQISSFYPQHMVQPRKNLTEYFVS